MSIEIHQCMNDTYISTDIQYLDRHNILCISIDIGRCIVRLSAFMPTVAYRQRGNRYNNNCKMNVEQEQIQMTILSRFFSYISLNGLCKVFYTDNTFKGKIK